MEMTSITQIVRRWFESEADCAKSAAQAAVDRMRGDQDNQPNWGSAQKRRTARVMGKAEQFISECQRQGGLTAGEGEQFRWFVRGVLWGEVVPGQHERAIYDAWEAMPK